MKINHYCMSRGPYASISEKLLLFFYTVPTVHSMEGKISCLKVVVTGSVPSTLRRLFA